MKKDEKSCVVPDLKSQLMNDIYENDDMLEGINAAVERAGRWFGVSRAYVFETDSDDVHTSNTFEWCAEGIEPQIDRLKHVDMKYYALVENCDDRGIFICSNTENLEEPLKNLLISQNIKAAFIYCMYEKGVCKGFVGLDDCVSVRNDWESRSDIVDILVYVGRIISLCLLKERNYRRADMLQGFVDAEDKNKIAVLSGLSTAFEIIRLKDNEEQETVYFSDKTAERFGYTCEEYDRLKGGGQKLEVYSGDVIRIEAALRNFFRTKENLQLSMRLKNKSGQYQWESITCCFDLSHSDEYYIFYSDMGEEAGIYSHIVEAASMGMYVVAKGTHEILFMNSWVMDIFGITDYYGKTCKSLMYNDRRTCNQCPMAHKNLLNKDHDLYIERASKYLRFIAEKVQWKGMEAFLFLVRDITEEKKLEERYRTIVENTPSGVVVCHDGKKGTLKAVFENEEFFNITRMTSQVFNSGFAQNFLTMICPEDMELFMFQLKLLRETGRFAANFRIRRNMYDYVWVHAVGSAHKVPDESSYYICFQDIDETINTKKDAELRRKSLEATIEHSKLIYWEYELDTRTAYVPDNITNAIGKGPIIQNFPESCIPGPLHPEECHLLYETFKKIDDGSMYEEFAARARGDESKEWKWFRFRISVIAAENGGKAVKAVCTAENIDAYKRLQQKFSGIMKQNNLVTWRYDVKVKKAVEMSTGSYVSKAIGEEGKPISLLRDRICDEDKPYFDILMNRINSGEKSGSERVRVYVDEKLYWYEIMFTNFFDENNEAEYAICSARNIHEEMENAELNTKMKLIFSNSTMLFWDYYIKEHKTVQMSGEDRVFARPTVFDNMPQTVIDTGVIFPEDEDKIRKLYRDIDEGAAVSTQVVRMYTSKDRLEYFRMCMHTVEPKTGEPVVAVGWSQDITKEQLQQERFTSEIVSQEDSVEGTLVGKAHVDFTNRIITNYVRHDNGFRADEIDDYIKVLDGIWLSDIENEEDRKRFRTSFDPKRIISLFNDGITKTSETYLRIMSGCSMWVRTDVNIYKNSLNGNIEGFFYSYNVDRQRKMELALSKITDSTYEYMVFIDTKSKLLVNMKTDKSGMNLSYLEKGINYDSWLGMYADKYSEESNTEDIVSNLCYDRIISQLEKNGSYSYSASIKIKGTTLFKKWDFTYLSETKSAILVLRSDITEVMNHEREQNKALHNAFIEANFANSAKTEFLSRMSHDMRTPMNGIIGMTALTLDIENLPDEARKNLQIISNSGKYLLNLINDTLDMNRIESSKLELKKAPTFVSEIINNVVTNVSVTAAAKNVTITATNNCEFDCNCYINADALRLQQIYSNLLSNAVKFTPENGRVELIINCSSEDNSIVDSIITVRDNGVGMSKEFVKKVFEPFSQESNSESNKYTGSGLGLSIVKNLVELMGGTIEVKSELGKGSEFITRIPFELLNDYTEERKEQAGNESLSGRRVLICEDHPVNALIAQKLLDKVGVICERAENGKIGLGMFERSGTGYYDAVLMDVRMPEMDGLEATMKIRSLERKDAKLVPIIAMTANSFESDVKMCLAAGMNSHLSKPFSPDVLYNVLAEHISDKK